MKGPSALIFSRQTLSHQVRTDDQLAAIKKGGYILKDCEGTPELILISTGSEVGITMQAAEQLSADGHRVRVVSMPCCEVFDKQDDDYKKNILPADVTARIAIEAGHTGMWYRYVGLNGRVIGLDRFGESAPGAVLFEHFGFTASNIIETAKELIA
jgi:transketolase